MLHGHVAKSKPCPELRDKECRGAREVSQGILVAVGLDVRLISGSEGVAQRIPRDTFQVVQFNDTGPRCPQEPPGYECTRLVIAAVGEFFEDLLEHKLEPRFETVAYFH